MNVLLMADKFFLFSLVIFFITLFMMVFLNGFCTFLGIILGTFLFSDRIKKIENRWREIDEDKVKKQRDRHRKSG